MTWPFENDTSAITKKLAKKSLQSEKRRNLMVVIAVALAAFLICFTGIVSTSLTQMQRNQVVDTYEAVWLGVGENDIETLKGLPEFERVGGYYMLGEELSEQGYHASYVYCDAQMMEIAKAQMELLEGRVPEKANEVVVSEYFLSTYGNNAKIGDTVTLDTESFQGDYVVTGIMDSVNEKEANTCAIILSKAALTEWNGFDPAGYRAYVHFKNSDQLGEELITSYCREIAEEYQLPTPSMNNRYFTYASKQPFDDFTLMAGVIALVLIGGYIVIQSIFRISINDKIKSYGQLRTIGATPKQIKRIVKREGRNLGSIGILIGTVLGVCGGFLLFPKGFNAVSYVATVILTLISSWIMVSISIRKPVKIAAGISPIEAVRFTSAQKNIRSRKKNIKLNPVSMGIANFKRDRKKTISIVASLSIGGILLMVVSSIVLVRSPEQIARLYFPDSDYKIYLQDLSEEMLVKGNPLDEELKQEVLSIDGVTDIIVARQSLYTSIKTDANQNSGICDTLTDQNYAMVEAALTAGTMPTDSHSIVIHDKIVAHFEDMGVGSTVEFSSVDGKKSSYNIGSVFHFKNACDFRAWTLSYRWFGFLCSKRFILRTAPRNYYL
jgi:putative ABC transport system permease protein